MSVPGIYYTEEDYKEILSDLERLLSSKESVSIYELYIFNLQRVKELVLACSEEQKRIERALGFCSKGKE